MSAWNLIWIIPAAVTLGLVLGGVLAAGRHADDCAMCQVSVTVRKEAVDE